ncbi:uncharacterized protein LOC6608478 isoform X1 [Drosophila sechellia]|uniref:uncharacterized protein LOC6608478 isoform X1 n=1 Tax=Drosophila sechellia TaxID=7238 RepID=UPI0013DE2E35|nr:uncharacterized protein LOC6608478 isoform X1 [Drosophila sechellia]
MLRENPPPRQKSWVGPTYRVTIIMLVIGQIQVSVAMEITPLKEFLADRYYLSLVQFVVSFLSIQLYGFFYHIIVKKPMWVRLLAGLWTYEVNTMSIMKPAKRAPYISLILSIILTFLMMIISVIYGNSAIKHKKGLFVSEELVDPPTLTSFTTDHPAQGYPVERADICAHLLWHHRVCRDEACYYRVSNPASIHHSLERGKPRGNESIHLLSQGAGSIFSIGVNIFKITTQYSSNFVHSLSWSLPLPCESRTSTARSRPGTTY